MKNNLSVITNKKRIVVIEDDSETRLILGKFLRSEGYEVIEAKDGFIGVQKVLHTLPDLIISDIQMPELSGIETYETLNQIPATMNIPFIFLTAKCDINEIMAGLQLGVDDYIVKPFEFNDLKKRIEIRIEKNERNKSINQTQLDLIFENPNYVNLLVDDSKIIRYNSIFSKITQYSEDELNKMYISFFLLLNDFVTITKNIQKIKEQEILSFKMEANLIIKSKALEPVIIYAHPIFMKKELIWISMHPKESFSFNNELTNYHNLSKREITVLKLICTGHNNKEIGEELNISVRTVDKHREALLHKTNCKNTAELLVLTFKEKIIKFG
ncbi:MAG: response regulator [Bacteroidota bacterium]|nr:response regulator [Bacteroidota bacterium]